MTFPFVRRLMLALLCLGLLAPVSSALAFDWSDNMVGLQLGTRYKEPGKTDEIGKWVGQFQHASGYKYGKQFFSVDYLRSNDNDPKKAGKAGASEVYAVYRHTLSLSALSGKSLKAGFVRDVGITGGLDLGTKNDAFNSQKQMWVVGPTVSFDVPGFWDVSVFYSQEHNHNGLAHKQVQFDPAWQLSTSWGIPVATPIPSQFKGFLNVIAPKGKDGFSAETKTETLLDMRWVFDIGPKLGAAKNAYFVGVSYQYWVNKFGNDHNKVVGSKASTPLLVAEVHF